MATTKLHIFSPDYAIHPGEILEETLAARNMQKSELAERCRLSTKTVSQIIGGKAPITPETAIQLERVLGVSAKVWSNLDTNHRLFQARRAAQAELRDNEEWVNQFPITHLTKRGIIQRTSNKIDIMEQLIDFLGVGSIAAWYERIRQMDVSYRQSPSFRSSPASAATWLRIGELRAEDVTCEPYNKTKFERALDKIRCLTHERPEVFEPQTKELCANAGVALVFVAELPRTHLSGATRWLTRDKALIMLSLRHKTDDHLWFSFFHEAGHILLHGRKAVFLDEDLMQQSEEEKQADQFAADALIPIDAYNGFLETTESVSEPAVLSFAQRLEIAPGIVVGRLQHDKKIEWDQLNHLKCRFQLVENRY